MTLIDRPLIIEKEELNAQPSYVRTLLEEEYMNLGHLKRWVARAVQKLLQAPIVIVHDKEEPMPGAFIIAAPRSGTTLLRLLIDSHPQIAAPPETQMFLPLLSVLDEERSVNAMWHLGFHRDSLAEALGNCARGFLEAYAKSKGKTFWVEKTPRYVSILPKLLEAFGNTKFLMLYRHPFDIVQSMMNLNFATILPEVASYRQHYPSDFAACCAFVANRHKLMMNFQRIHPDITYELRYERIVSAPEYELRQMCAFLGVEFDPVMLNFTNSSHDIGFGDEKIYDTQRISPRLHTYEAWTKDYKEEAFKILEEDLITLGYSI